MIPFHGGPITPITASLALWQRRHAFVSFANPAQIELAAEIAQSFALDNGAFTIWKQGGAMDIAAYAAWVNAWRKHPGYDWCLIPDVIDGDEHANDVMVARWREAGGDLGEDVPVWHMHESFDRLRRLCHAYRRVALGSSGEFASVGTDPWWNRMGLAMDAICDSEGRPPCKLHGLRMLNPRVFSRLPLASADSTNVAQNIGIDQRWRHPYAPSSKALRALVIADRIEHHGSAPRWQRPIDPQTTLDLVG